MHIGAVYGTQRADQSSVSRRSLSASKRNPRPFSRDVAGASVMLWHAKVYLRERSVLLRRSGTSLAVAWQGLSP